MNKQQFTTPSEELLNLLFKEVVEQDEYNFKSIDKEIDYFIDIGANIGVTTSFVLETLDIRKGVICLEPEPYNYECLCNNLAQYDTKTQLIILNEALGDGTPVYMTTQPKNPGMYRTMTNKVSNVVSPSISLEKLFLALGITADDRILFKCDCEGGEFNLMNAKSEQLLQTFYQISMEVHYGQKYFENCPTKEEYQAWFKTFRNFEIVDQSWVSNNNGKMILRNKNL